MADELTWLMDWYAAQCDGDWEHDFGIAIGTLDNPGWSLTIDLDGTPYEDRPFAPVSHNISQQEAVQGPSGEKSWWDCKVEDSTFKAFGGLGDLPAMITIFRIWAETTRH